MCSAAQEIATTTAAHYSPGRDAAAMTAAAMKPRRDWTEASSSDPAWALTTAAEAGREVTRLRAGSCGPARTALLLSEAMADMTAISSGPTRRASAPGS